MELAFAPAAVAAVVAGLGVELRLFAPRRMPRRTEAIVWSIGWLLLAVGVAAGIAVAGGPSGEWTTVYLIERSLSLDNVFLFSLLIAYFLADIAFAVDSIPAAFAVTRDPEVIWTANGFALLGLGSLLALVDILVRRFRYLDKTIALILAFVGLKILAADLVHISDLGSLAIIALLLIGGAVASLVADRLDPPHPTEEATRRPPRCPQELTPPR